jgi:hypothetical protein
MFEDAISYNQPLHDWDVHNAQDMSRMFYEAISFQQSLNAWYDRLPPIGVKKDNLFGKAYSYVAKECEFR